MRGIDDVHAFNQAMGFPPYSDLMTKDEIDEKRTALIDEEGGEFMEAIASEDNVAILHEGIDLMYIIHGAFVEAGITQAQVEAAWHAVHQANMQKTAPSHPKLKAGKPEGWRKANIKWVLKNVKDRFVRAFVCFTDGKGMNNTTVPLHDGFNQESLEIARAAIAQAVGASNANEVVLVSVKPYDE